MTGGRLAAVLLVMELLMSCEEEEEFRGGGTGLSTLTGGSGRKEVQGASRGKPPRVAPRVRSAGVLFGWGITISAFFGVKTGKLAPLLGASVKMMVFVCFFKASRRVLATPLSCGGLREAAALMGNGAGGSVPPPASSSWGISEPPLVNEGD